MTMLTYPRTPTPVTPAESVVLFVQRYSQAFGRPPDRDTAAGLLTLLWHENAKGRSVIQYNWGNLAVPATKLESLPHWRPEWMDQEYLDSLPDSPKKTRLLQLRSEALAGTAPVAFRAFFSHEAGLDAWLALLLKPSMRHILRAAETGSARRMWRAVAYPNPALAGSKVSYCPHCRTDAVRHEYAKLHQELDDSGLLAGLQKKKRSDNPQWDSALERLSWRRLRFSWLPRLALGDEGDAVAMWQCACNWILWELDSPALAVDGRFGKRTYEATQVVQDASATRDHHGGLVSVPITGIVDHTTWSLAFRKGQQ